MVADSEAEAPAAPAVGDTDVEELKEHVDDGDEVPAETPADEAPAADEPEGDAS
jgi:hypothetical protein